LPDWRISRASCAPVFSSRVARCAPSDPDAWGKPPLITLSRDEAQRLSAELTNNLGSSAQQTKLLFLASPPRRASACFWRGTYYSTRGRTGGRSRARSSRRARSHGRGTGVGRGRGDGVSLGVAVAVAVGVGVGVGEPDGQLPLTLNT